LKYFSERPAAKSGASYFARSTCGFELGFGVLAADAIEHDAPVGQHLAHAKGALGSAAPGHQLSAKGQLLTGTRPNVGLCVGSPAPSLLDPEAETERADGEGGAFQKQFGTTLHPTKNGEEVANEIRRPTPGC